MELAGRLEQLRTTLRRQGFAGGIIGRPANVHYLSGFPAVIGRPSLLVVSDERAVFVGPGNAASIRSQVGADIAVIGYPVPGATVDQVADVDRLSAEALAGAIDTAGLSGQRVGFEDAHLSARHARCLERHAQAVPIDGDVEAQRRIKGSSELTLIRAAVELNDIGFQEAQNVIAPGVSEWAVQAAIVQAMQERSEVPIDLLDETNCIISGPRTAGAVGLATGRQLASGDLLILDLNPFVRAYKGDTTRTFCAGPPSSEYRRMHDAVVRALEAAETMIRPGVRGRDVYAALIQPIVDAGYADGLAGHGGHAIGLEHLERPYIIAGEDMPLAAGMVITLEPGIYLSGKVGIRVEDNYLVTNHGVELLSHFTRDLVACS